MCIWNTDGTPIRRFYKTPRFLKSEQILAAELELLWIIVVKPWTRAESCSIMSSPVGMLINDFSHCWSKSSNNCGFAKAGCSHYHPTSSPGAQVPWPKVLPCRLTYTRWYIHFRVWKTVNLCEPVRAKTTHWVLHIILKWCKRLVDGVSVKK